MKKFNLILLFMLPIWVFSQDSYLDDLFDKYSGQEGYTSVYITKYMFELFAEVSTDKEVKDFNDVTSKLNAIKILTTNDKAGKKQVANFKKEVIRSLPSKEYQDLMIVKDGKQDVTFKIRKNSGKITELLMLVSDETETVLIYLSGDINLKKISKLSKSMKVTGLEHLSKIEKK